MNQFQGVPGPSQDDFNTLSEQMANFKAKMPTSMDAGVIKFPAIQTTGYQDVEITFAQGRFSIPPVVVANFTDTVATTNYFELGILIVSTTTTGCTVRAKRLQAGSDWYARYLAVQM